MGMFDDVICLHVLPGNPPARIQRARFQTKDFECLLDQYTITEAGAITIDLCGPAGNQTPTQALPFHGAFRFCHLDLALKKMLWWEYEATFTHEALEEIKAIEAGVPV